MTAGGRPVPGDVAAPRAAWPQLLLVGPTGKSDAR